MTAHLRDLTGKPDLLAFSVLRDGELVGRTCYYDVVGGIRVDIGNTIYGREVWGTMVNPTCKLLLLTHAFEQLEVHRVGMRCDHRNARSHAAIRKLGATFEGTLRCFRPAADGTVADVDYFSVLREEWPQVRAGLEQRLEGWQRPAG
jgi:RimJ/RimL family protein N-acetyltransferase